MDLAHSVPQDRLEDVENELAKLPRGAGPTHAERARTLAHSRTTGALATIARRPAGYPFGSVVTYALDEIGRPVLSLSDLAEHSKNLAHEARGSLLVTEEATEADTLAAGRVTLVGSLAEVPADQGLEARDRYIEVHSDSYWVDFDDFRFYRLEVEAVRFVGGFGMMSWVRAEDYSRALPDPVAPAAPGIIRHLNNDHVEALVVYAQAFGGAPDATFASAVGADRYGFDLLADTPQGRRALRVDFSEPVRDPDEVREASIALLREGRALLDNV